MCATKAANKLLGFLGRNMNIGRRKIKGRTYKANDQAHPWARFQCLRLHTNKNLTSPSSTWSESPEPKSKNYRSADTIGEGEDLRTCAEPPEYGGVCPNYRSSSLSERRRRRSRKNGLTQSCSLHSLTTLQLRQCRGNNCRRWMY